jgi:GDPmannose 4,6-dehydratase
MINLIIGHNGQDGTILKQKIQKLNQIWIGLDRNGILVSNNLNNTFEELFFISNSNHVELLISLYRPDKIFYLAAHHHSSTGYIDDNIDDSINTNVIGPLYFLKAISKLGIKSKFLYVSSSLIYKPIKNFNYQINEMSEICPIENYSCEKVLAGQYCKYFREKFDIHASVAIPFNHESKYRKKGFFTRDATDALAKIKLGFYKTWEVGSLISVVDMLHANDVVDAFMRILDLDSPDDFIIASGVAHTTGDFLDLACNYIGIDVNKVIKVNKNKIFRENIFRIGNSQKLIEKTNWRQTIKFESIVKILMDDAMIRIIDENK